MLRIGRHSSSPSCQHSDSSVTAPAAAFRRSSEIRTGPTGTPLIATYHSSVTLSSIEGRGATLSGDSSTLLLKALASELGASDGFGFAAERLVANPRCKGRGAFAGRGGAVETLVSVTAARTSIWCPHLRHFMRTVLPATFSSAI